MSYLSNQMSTFKSHVSSSATKINKRTVNAAPDRMSTPPLSSQSSKNDLKRKRPEQHTAYSQPADTGKGNNMMTQVTYAVEYLKGKTTPQTLTDIISYLSVQHQGERYRRTLGSILMQHEKVEFERKDDGGEGTYRFRPIHNIRSKGTLLEFLQQQRTAQGLSVKDVRDGWPGAEAAIDELEVEGKLLLTRNKKDNHAKMMWANDSSLSYQIDEEFQDIWEKIRLPDPKILAEELERNGLVPANKNKAIRKPVKLEAEKKKKTRRGGKTTNTHMAGVLKDYSHLKK
ncbi:uncharacterized protein KY384_004389 [Bacidia gigantensis]|uniref:uncharacterized protein n=1 Tax=Bacidia gigantensis TaxID=2732470 RepID=UPI001D054E09|nr:uncharacterized protein KY384_004389 [Bacidia gigantensis]KAG8531032.1 hypothetical protein KY384_004389 [Bacidia gigantensis]